MNSDARKEYLKRYYRERVERIKEREKQRQKEHPEEFAQRRREAVRRYRQRHRDRVKAYKIRYHDEHPEQSRDRRRRLRAGDKSYIQANREYRLANPEKTHARNLLQSAVRHGKLLKSQFCQLCLVPTRLEGHHEDYSKPLEVVWLCRFCHASIEGTSRLWRKPNGHHHPAPQPAASDP